jgi:hypothetical protein
MKNLSQILLALGFVLLVYAVFSRFYGQPSVALIRFRSLSFLVLANIVFVLSLIAKQKK